MKGSGGRLVPNPYLHLRVDGIYDPHGDRSLGPRDLGYALLEGLVESGEGVRDEGGPELRSLAEAAWLVPEHDRSLDRAYRIRYVSIETRSECNQACSFCPVSVAPRPHALLPTVLFERIVTELADLGEPIEAVFLNGYNEPTIDVRYLDQVRTLHRAGFAVATLSNGTGLTPSLVDALVDMGGIGHLSVNLSTLDPDAYRRERGRDHLARVLTHLDHARDRAVAADMRIVVLGAGDDAHDEAFAAICLHFEGSRFHVERFVANDRAGRMSGGGLARVDDLGRRLAGCEQMGSRPLQHLHVVASGRCVLCCQDYDEAIVLGDLHEQSVAEVLASDAYAQARRQAYGLESAGPDLPCRSCAFALTRPAGGERSETST